MNTVSSGVARFKRIRLTEFASEDIISRMPENVITNILDRLPLQEAMRTSILSSSWRFSWTLLTQLVLDYQFYRYLESKKQAHLFYKKNLAKLLLHHKGSITKFVLYAPPAKEEENNTMYADIVEDINHWILFLSTKGIEEFTLINTCNMPVMLSSHLFSCLELKHLKLQNCCLHPPPGFHCFPNLLSFEFLLAKLHGCKFGEFITRCTPLLENLDISCLTLTSTPYGKVKLDEIAKLINLKTFSLMLQKLGDTMVTSSDIIQLVGSLPKLEKLNLDFGLCTILAKAGVSERLSANLHCLKTLELKNLHFGNNIMVECACDLINGLPNLQNLKMTAAINAVHVSPPPPPGSSRIQGNIKCNLQLQYVEFECFTGSKIEQEFIKSLLVYSSLLKKMVIREQRGHNHNNRCCTFARELLKLHRASPVAEIHLC